jgi:uncharacterized protein DUF4149
VIVFLRFIGVINAAVWLGGAVFFTFSVGTAFFSPEMAAVLGVGEDRFRYFAGGIAQVVLKRYYYFHIACAVVAWVHLLAEWLYLGRPSRKLSFALLAVLFLLTVVGGNGLQPKLQRLREVRYLSAVPAERDEATRSFALWHRVSLGLNFLMIGGLIVYIWRVANPSDNARYISSVKFRG